MVIQRSWKNSNPDVLLQNSSSEDSSGSWQLPPSNRGVSNSQTSNSMPNRHVINRQVALNTLAAMHRRYNIPGMVQTSGRPPAEFRASANKSLDILRQNIQSAVTKEIDQVIKKYLEKFFVPAVNNIRSNLGEESVGEDQVRAVCRAMLDGARCLYAAPPRSSAHPPSQPPRTPHHAPSPSELSDSESSNGADSRFGRPSSSPSWKRKESDTDSDVGTATRRKRRTEGAVCPAHKWDPARLNPDTLFIMGSIANKVLGLGQSRGRLYSKHAGLLRYPADSADKEWIANQNMTTPAGGRTYIMVLEDIEELVCSEDYRHSPALRLNELSGFRAPPFMLRKIQAYLCRRGEMSEDYTSSTPTPTPPPLDVPILKSQIKLEEPEDSSDAVNVKMEQTDDQPRDHYKNLNNEDIVDQQFPFTSNNQLVKMENCRDRSFKYDNNGNSQQIIQPCGNFTSIVSAGVSNMDNNYWKCISGNQGDNSEKVELNAATEFIDADIEFLSSDFCTYVDSEADVKKSFDRISDGGGGGDLFMSGDTNLLTSSPNSSGLSTHTVNYNHTSQENAVSRPGIVTSFVGSIAVGPMASNIVHTYVSASMPNTLVKSPSVTASHITSSPSSFPHPNNPITFTQALNTFSQNSPISHAQVISQMSPSNSNANTITLQPNIMQPTTRTVYSLASTTKAITPGSTIIGFGTRPAIGGNIINAGNFINIATKNFSSGNILHNAIVSRNMINRGMNITRSELSKPTIINTNTLTVGKSSTTQPCVSGITYSSKSSHSKMDDDASITTTKAMIDNTCNSSAMLKKVLTLGSAGVNKTFLTPPTQKMNASRASGSNSSNLSASHATLTALLSSGTSDSTHSDKKNSFIVPTTEK